MHTPSVTSGGDEPSKVERVLALAAEHGVLRPKDLAAEGIQAEYLRRICDKGLLKKIGRGSYVLADREVDPMLQLEVAARAVPNGVICLRSALAFHGLGDTPRDEVDIAIERRAAQPRLDFPNLRTARMGGEAFTEGVEQHAHDGVTLAIYGVNKTLTDLFKFRNKLGPHIAVDALRAALGAGKLDAEQLWHYARINRVDRVMKPYVDALMRS